MSDFIDIINEHIPGCADCGHCEYSSAHPCAKCKTALVHNELRQGFIDDLDGVLYQCEQCKERSFLSVLFNDINELDISEDNDSKIFMYDLETKEWIDQNVG